MNRPARCLALATLLLNGAACMSMTPPEFLKPTPAREWKPALQRAQEYAAAGQAGRADSVLADFAARYPGSAGARETYYWRSLIALQSSTQPEMSPSQMLGLYLDSEGAEHRVEAAALTRISARVDSLARIANALQARVQVSNGEVASATNRAADAKADARTAAAETRDQDAEIRRLRSELASAKEELERIKKRLAEPPKKPPV